MHTVSPFPFILRALVVGAWIVSSADQPALAANMRNYIEAVRLNAPVVYVGVVREVQFVSRDKFEIKARAAVSVSAVARGPGSTPAEATFNYSTYDDRNPMLCGPLQYQLHPGTIVVVFAKSFSDREYSPLCLLQGNRKELLKQVEAIRNNLSRMSGDQLRVNEITKKDRNVQMALYDRLCKDLRASSIP